MISDKKKFIFIHINKTGGTSIGNVLCGLKNLKIRKSKHHSMSEIHKLESYDDYFKFTFVRNPWERMVSMYHYRWERKIKNTRSLTFDQWLKSLNKTVPNKFTGPQHGWIVDKKGKVFIDYVGKFEKLQKDFDVICERLGIGHQALPHLNPSSHTSYQSYYTSQSKRLVAQMYKKDIETFNYTFKNKK